MGTKRLKKGRKLSMLALLQIILSYFVGIILFILLIIWCFRRIKHSRYRSAFVFIAFFVLVGSLIAVTRSGLQINVPAPLPSSVRLIVSDTSGALQGLRASDASNTWSSFTGVKTRSLTSTTMSGDLIYKVGIPYSSAGSSANQILRSLVAVRANDGQLVWRKDISFSSQTKLDCPPHINLLVAEGKVYTCQGNTLYAFQASNGEQAWSLPMKQVNPTASPLQSFTAGEGLLFLSSQSGDTRALRATNGALVWQSHMYRGIALTLANKILYIADEGFVFALRAQDGRLLWQFSNEGLIPESLSATNTHVYVGIFDDSLTKPSTSISLDALDSQTGGLLWQQTVAIPSDPSDLAGPIETKPGEADKTLYVIASFTLTALRTSDGSQLWRYQLNNGFLLWQGPDDRRGFFLTLVEVNGVVFLPVDEYKSVFTFPYNRPQNGIVALNAANGTLYWSQFDLAYQARQWVGVAS
jgi:outer membrane protein assembly factor BamB